MKGNRIDWAEFVVRAGDDPLTSLRCARCHTHRRNHMGEVAASLKAAVALIELRPAPPEGHHITIREAVGYVGVIAAYALFIIGVALAMYAFI